MLIALVAGLRIPLHFYNHELSCYLAQALNIVFVVQPEFKEFLNSAAFVVQASPVDGSATTPCP